MPRINEVLYLAVHAIRNPIHFECEQFEVEKKHFHYSLIFPSLCVAHHFNHLSIQAISWYNSMPAQSTSNCVSFIAYGLFNLGFCWSLALTVVEL